MACILDCIVEPTLDVLLFFPPSSIQLVIMTPGSNGTYVALCSLILIMSSGASRLHILTENLHNKLWKNCFKDKCFYQTEGVQENTPFILYIYIYFFCTFFCTYFVSFNYPDFKEVQEFQFNNFFLNQLDLKG